MRRLLIVLLIATLGGLAVYSQTCARPGVASSSVLVLELWGGVEEKPALETLDRLLVSGVALPTLVLQLEKAAADERVQAVLLHIRPLDVGFSQLQELRDAVRRVRGAGKSVIALLDLVSQNATRELYLASSAEKVYIVPGFLGSFAGVAGQFFSLGGLFEKIGVGIEYERIGRYKSAPERFANRELSEDARRVINELIDGIFGQVVHGIAEGRGLDNAEVRRLIDQAPSTAAAYVDAGLADGVAGREEVLEVEGLEAAEELSWDDYLRVDPRDLGLRNGPQIALIFGEGAVIQRGRARSRGLQADAIEAALEEAAEDEDVRAIVLRIDSPGGSSLASEQIWRGVRQARERKPVVVSMGDTAASGGYYIASAADAIVAQPGTLTGSIGVFFLHPDLTGLYRKLGIGSEVIARGPYASVATGGEPLTAAQREKTRLMVESVYDSFLQRVATGRGMTREQVDRLGQGRVWLGETALAHGLVDELGGLRAAVERAKTEAGIAPDVDPERVIFPGPRSLSEQVLELMQANLAQALLERLAPIEIPEILWASSQLIAGEIAYLPSYWLEIY